MNVISDFNADLLGTAINRYHKVHVSRSLCLGNYINHIRYCDEDPSCRDVVIWVRPESISREYYRAISFLKYSYANSVKEIACFIDAVKSLAKTKRSVMVVNFCLPLYFRGQGPFDLDSSHGLSYLVFRLNMFLYDSLQDIGNVYVLDQERWLRESSSISNNKLWYAGKIPYSLEVFEIAALDILSGINLLQGNLKKVIVLDLDNTLWGGVVGEVGWRNIRLGGHDHIGEAFSSFQDALVRKKNKGIILTIASKNNEKTALEVFEENKEMRLKITDFASWRINWNDKAQNIVEISRELNLGLDTFVFIDDNPIERDRVGTALPDVFVPDWPIDPCDYPVTLEKLHCFDSISISEEDRNRTQMLLNQQNRDKHRILFKSETDWLKSIGTRLYFESIDDTNIKRIVQLLNKTNQFNLKTRRLTETQLLDWLDRGNREMIAVRVKDNFGDSGLCGLFSIDFDGKHAVLEDFILSCRVMGRNIEDVMIAKALEYSRRSGFSNLIAECIPTDRNLPILSFLDRSGIAQSCSYKYNWNTEGVYDYPEHIAVISS